MDIVFSKNAFHSPDGDPKAISLDYPKYQPIIYMNPDN